MPPWIRFAALMLLSMLPLPLHGSRHRIDMKAGVASEGVAVTSYQEAGNKSGDPVFHPGAEVCLLPEEKLCGHVMGRNVTSGLWITEVREKHPRKILPKVRMEAEAWQIVLQQHEVPACISECSLERIGDKYGEDAAKRLRETCNVAAGERAEATCATEFSDGFWTSSTRRGCCLCLAAQPRPLSTSPCIQFSDVPKDVFVAAYHIQDVDLKVKTFSIFHTNLAFCKRLNDPAEIPPHIGATESSNLAVQTYLKKYDCDEVAWDGRYAGNVWSVKEVNWRLGSWPPESDQSASAFGKGGLFYVGRTTTKISTLTSALRTCHGANAEKEWWDFNPDTYHLLSHNCNSFTYKSLKYLSLPNRFATPRSAEEVMAPLAVENSDVNAMKHRIAKMVLNDTTPVSSWISPGCKSAAVKVGLMQAIAVLDSFP